MSREESLRRVGAAVDVFNDLGALVKGVMDETGATADEVIAVLSLDALGRIDAKLELLLAREDG